jgi:hypothetical protein
MNLLLELKKKEFLGLEWSFYGYFLRPRIKVEVKNSVCVCLGGGGLRLLADALVGGRNGVPVTLITSIEAFI